VELKSGSFQVELESTQNTSNNWLLHHWCWLLHNWGWLLHNHWCWLLHWGSYDASSLWEVFRFEVNLTSWHLVHEELNPLVRATWTSELNHLNSGLTEHLSTDHLVLIANNDVNDMVHVNNFEVEDALEPGWFFSTTLTDWGSFFATINVHGDEWRHPLKHWSIVELKSCSFQVELKSSQKTSNNWSWSHNWSWLCNRNWLSCNNRGSNWSSDLLLTNDIKTVDQVADLSMSANAQSHLVNSIIQKWGGFALSVFKNHLEGNEFLPSIIEVEVGVLNALSNTAIHLVKHGDVALHGWGWLVKSNHALGVLLGGAHGHLIDADWWLSLRLLQNMNQVRGVLSVLGRWEFLLNCVNDLSKLLGSGAHDVHSHKDFFLLEVFKLSSQEVVQFESSELLLKCQRLFF